MSGLDISAADSIAEIRAAVGIVALLQAGGELSDADMRAAVTCIEQELRNLDRLTGSTPGVGAAVMLPIMTLGEVAARARYRAKPVLQLVEGGRA